MQENQWNEFAALYAKFERQRLEFLTSLKPMAAVLRDALKDASTRGAALELVNHISDDERKQLFEDLLILACYAHKYQNDAFLAVCALPRQWAAIKVEDHLASILNRATEEEFGLLLHVLNEINLDIGLTRNIFVTEELGSITAIPTRRIQKAATTFYMNSRFVPVLFPWISAWR